MNKPFFKQSTVILLVLSLFFVLAPAYGFEQSGSYDFNRARLLGYILQQYLGSHHYSHKKIDDTLSKAAFDLYIKQLDSQKRFLLKADVDKLKTFSDKIDDDILSGRIDLPGITATIFERRVSKMQGLVKEILSKNFDFSTDELLETDPEKLDYCKSEAELKERWRKTLKLQVLNRYLNLVEDEASSAAVTDSSRRIVRSAGQLQETAREKVLKSYEEIFSRMQKEKESERFDRYFNAFTRAFDPHTDYMPPINKEDFDISMKGSLEGIGATLREDEGYIKIVSIIPGSPASRQGQLQAEDIILKVAEGAAEPVDLADMMVKDAVRLIRGKKGTEVRLTIRKQTGTQIIVPIIRDLIQLEDTFAKGATLKDPVSGKTFGYIKLPTFYRDFEKTGNGGKGRNSTDDVRQEIEKFGKDNISGLILDLRNNGGGALADSVSIAGLFIKTGPVVQVKDSEGNIKVLSDDDPATYYDGPLVILVNKFSASASEILAGAMQDYGRAVIIGGEHTHGKGTVQAIMDLNNSVPFSNMEKFKPLGALKITIQKFYRVSGESTQYRGILPDIVLPDQLRCLKTGEQYLENALSWDTVSPANYSKWSPGWTDINSIKSKSASRFSSRKDFKDLEAKSNRICEQQKKTVQSLNIDTVKREQEEAKQRKEKDGPGPHGHANMPKKSSDVQLSEKEKMELLIKEMSEDPYVQESIQVMGDMVIRPEDQPVKAINAGK